MKNRFVGLNKVELAVCLSLTLLLSLVVFSGCAEGDEEATDPDPLQTSEEMPEPEEFEALASLEQLLDPIHPDESVDHTLNERFSFENSLKRLQQIVEFGQDDDADFETQMGFENWTGAVKGTLYKQNYEIKKLEFELARRLYRDYNEISLDELETAEEEYEEALEQLQTIWDDFSIMD